MLLNMPTVFIHAFSNVLTMNAVTVTPLMQTSAVAIIMAVIVLSALLAGFTGLFLAIIQGPGFEKKAHTFDIVTFTDRSMAVASKPAIKWETPESLEAVFEVKRIPTGHHTYAVLP